MTPPRQPPRRLITCPNHGLRACMDKCDMCDSDEKEIILESKRLIDLLDRAGQELVAQKMKIARFEALVEEIRNVTHRDYCSKEAGHHAACVHLNDSLLQIYRDTDGESPKTYDKENQQEFKLAPEEKQIFVPEQRE